MRSLIRISPARLLLAAALALAAGISGAAPKVYVGNFKDNTVSVIDTVAGAIVATVPVAAGPHGIALTPGGGLLLVAINGEDRVAFVDTAMQSVVATVGVPKPHTIAIRPDGKVAYVASQEPGHFALVVVDLAARAVVRTIALDKPPRDLEFGHDGKALYFTKAGLNAVQVLDPASDRIVAEIPSGVSPHYANFFPATTLGVVVVQGPGELLLFDPATNKPVRSIGVGKQPHWVTAASDGQTAYVTNEGSNDLSIVDLGTGKTTAIAVGNAPRKVVVQPTARGAKVSIANFAFMPAQVTIAPGESVSWSNDDGAPHAIAFKDGSSGADSLAPGTTFRRVFDKAGSYEYFCSFHPYMTARVAVRAK